MYFWPPLGSGFVIILFELPNKKARGTKKQSDFSGIFQNSKKAVTSEYTVARNRLLRYTVILALECTPVFPTNAND